MSGFRLSRRAVLRGAGGIAIALPWLEIMQPERRAHAAAPAAKRFIGVFTPGGTVLENWRPTGMENDFTLSPILQPLASVRDRLIVVDGVDMKSAVGEQRQSGIVAWLTGTPQPTGSGSYARGPSIDQVLASRLSAGLKLASLELAVRWGTGRTHGKVSPFDIASYADTPTFDPVPPRIDPQQIWKELFGAPPPITPDGAWDKSILDAVDQRYKKLEQRLGAADRKRLDSHLTQLRELEVRLPSSVPACSVPTLVDTSDYNPVTGLMSADNGSVVDASTDAAIPKTGKFMLDMLVMALACDLTRVATFLWSDTEAKHTFPWLDLNQTLAYYMNDGGYQPVPLTKIYTWYATQHAYLLQRLSETKGVAGASLLDESVVFFGSNLQNPANYAKTDMPFLLAGGGGLRTNRWVSCGHASHNDLLVSILNVCGDARQTFGDPLYCTGPLAGLT